MMELGGTAHILMVLASIIIGVSLFLIVKHSSRKVQNIIIYLAASMCVFGIFFLHGTRYFTDITLDNLLIQQLQVCNFNFILRKFQRNNVNLQYEKIRF